MLCSSTLKTSNAFWSPGGLRLLLLAGCSLVGLLSQPANAHKFDPPPPAERAANEPPPRNPDDISKELNETKSLIADIIPSMEAVMDETKRAEMAPKALPHLRKLNRLLGEMARAMPEAADQLLDGQMEIRAIMALMDDKQSVDEIARLTASKDPKESTDAKSWSIAVRWAAARKDPRVQERLADELLFLARAQPTNAMIAQATNTMVDTSATPALAEQIEKIVTDELKNPLAKRIGESMASKRKLRNLVNKPLTIDGTTVGGGKFTTAGWKGKVILVDFWATWCASCMTDLPKVKQAYADFHAKGLEIVGVSSDRDTDDVKGFLAKNKDAPWPQLFEPGQGGWNPLAQKLGIESLPVLMLIDRKGNVRLIGNNADVLGMIPKLLEEKE